MYQSPATATYPQGAPWPSERSFARAYPEITSGVDVVRYEHVVARLLSRYSASKAHTSRELWAALDDACHALVVAGTSSDEQAKLLRACVSRDLAHVASVLVRGEGAREKGILRLAQHRGPVRMLVEALRLSGDAIYRLAGEAGRVELRRAGEVTCAGTLSCPQCGTTHRSTQSLVVTPCAGCGAAEHAKALRA